MNRHPDERIEDILRAANRCLAYRAYVNNPDEVIASMAYDALLRRLTVIGDAVRALPPELTHRHPEIPWASIAGLRNVVVHEYFRIDMDLITDVVDNHLPRLAAVLANPDSA